ncbi:branched-chain amino acid ABC transporter permease [Pararobbsia silviterrae]|uniref:Branched-chain amino acid ABC transporter permease n=1 Tax=Pararobbsia silviterrae TaxID=1792498 RepID=A0A494XI11_9BURK|nr:branched-chain amino acid ABC transporter permease [Pararobbsia silviterrae]RKP47183.1 branched-chain amino acid ABC transporter permease [Pararobbsia silviterrae]
MSDWINVLIEGLLLGGLYALFATGLSLAFGIMRIVNIGHGDLAVLGAFVAITLSERFGLSPWMALLLGIPLMGALGYVMQRTLLERTLGSDILPPILVTFGISIILRNTLLEVYSADPRSLGDGALTTASIALPGDIAIGVLPLTIMIVAIVVLAALQWMFSSTRLGRAFRATSDDPATAQLMGLNHKRVYGVAMAIAVAVAGVAGVFLALRANVSPSEGQARLLYAFEAVIIGGLGSLWGTLAGGAILGVAQTAGMKLDPGWGILAGHLVFFVVLLARPNGLFPRTRDR